MTHGLMTVAAEDRAEPLAEPARVQKWGTIMRKLRLSLVGTVILVLLGGTGGLALAQDDEEEGAATLPVLVTGNLESCSSLTAGTSKPTDTVNPTTHNLMQLCRLTMSDPRLSGDYINNFNFDCHIGALCVFWGTQEFNDPRRGWECRWGGTGDLALETWGHVSGVCAGTSGYEGLTFAYRHVFDVSGGGDFGDGTNYVGVRYEGDPPPWP